MVDMVTEILVWFGIISAAPATLPELIELMVRLFLGLSLVSAVFGGIVAIIHGVMTAQRRM